MSPADGCAAKVPANEIAHIAKRIDVDQPKFPRMNSGTAQTMADDKAILRARSPAIARGSMSSGGSSQHSALITKRIGGA